ncbi:MAG: hypothetical protein WKF97_20005 [Chitinophagaceae bacterium]
MNKRSTFSYKFSSSYRQTEHGFPHLLQALNVSGQATNNQKIWVDLIFHPVINHSSNPKTSTVDIIESKFAYRFT